MRKEITIPIDLTRVEESRIAMHSFYNVLNVIYTELQLLRKILAAPDALADSLSLCRELSESFGNPGQALASVRRIENYKPIILQEIQNAISAHPQEPPRDRMIGESLMILHRILDVIEIRVREILARQGAEGSWVQRQVEEVVEDMRIVFRVISLHARERFGVVFDPAEQTPSDYLILFDMAGDSSGRIRLPLVFTDVIRDLSANARKYASPGSTIRIRLAEEGGDLHLCVMDQGRGIPADQMEEIVRFGVRATNTRPEETKGGGFGLTKAYFIARQFSGRMWIESEEGVGTTIEIRIPLPTSSLTEA